MDRPPAQPREASPQVFARDEGAPAWTGNPSELLDRSHSELRTMAAAGERLLAKIRRDGRAVVGSMNLIPAPGATRMADTARDVTGT